MAITYSKKSIISERSLRIGLMDEVGVLRKFQQLEIYMKEHIEKRRLLLTQEPHWVVSDLIFNIICHRGAIAVTSEAGSTVYFRGLKVERTSDSVGTDGLYGTIRLVYETYEIESMDVASLYPKTVIAPCPIEKLHNFCSDNHISVEGGCKSGKYVVTFSKFGVPFTVSFDSYTDYIGMGLDKVNTIIEKLKARNAALKIWANSFYGMSSGERPTGKLFEIVEYSKEDVMATINMAEFYSNSFKAMNAVGENQLKHKLFGIKKVIFNKEATVVLWKDGTKTVVKCQDGDSFDYEKGLAMAICKKALGTNESHSNFNDIFKKWIPED